MNITKQTKVEKLSSVIEILANDFTEQERTAILSMDFTPLRGLSGKQLKNRISRSKMPWILGPDTSPFA